MLPPWTRAAPLLLAFSAWSCADPTVNGPVMTHRPPRPPAPTENGDILSVVAAAAPASAVIDGDLTEWGALPLPLPSLPAPVDRMDRDEPDAKGGAGQALNPPDAPSRVAVAFSDRGALIAAELGEGSREGIWLGIGAAPADLPPPGRYSGNLGYVPLSGGPDGCNVTMKVLEDGQAYTVTKSSPAEVAACQAALVRYAELKAKHVKRFARVYRIDPQGVWLMSEDGSLTAIPGAIWAFKAHDKGATMEALLPLAALPRFAEAPLQTVRLVARPASSAAPPRPAPPAQGAWVWVKLPAPVSFEPHSGLRAHAFKRTLDYGPAGVDGLASTSYRLPRALSYQPGDPSHLEVVDSADCVSPSAREVPLYTRETTLGDVEVGHVAAPRGSSCSAENEPWIAIFARGELTGIEPTGSPRGAVVRGGEIHVLSYTETPSSNVPGVWSVIAVAAGGARRRELVEPVAGLTSGARWRESADFIGPDLDGFGFRAAAGARGLEAIWRWDAARRVYVGKQRFIPPPRASKGGRAR